MPLDTLTVSGTETVESVGLSGVNDTQIDTHLDVQRVVPASVVQNQYRAPTGTHYRANTTGTNFSHEHLLTRSYAIDAWLLHIVNNPDTASSYIRGLYNALRSMIHDALMAMEKDRQQVFGAHYVLDTLVTWYKLPEHPHEDVRELGDEIQRTSRELVDLFTPKKPEPAEQLQWQHY